MFDVDHYRHALQTAVRNNSAAFGFSLVVTGGFGILTGMEGSPTGWEAVLWGLGAVAAFSTLDLLATRGFKRKLATEPPDVITHAASFSFASVAIGIGAAVGFAELTGGLLAWAGAGFIGSAVYNLGLGFELLAAMEASGED